MCKSDANTSAHACEPCGVYVTLAQKGLVDTVPWAAEVRHQVTASAWQGCHDFRLAAEHQTVHAEFIVSRKRAPFEFLRVHPCLKWLDEYSSSLIAQDLCDRQAKR